jgi:hypothetical protein
MPFEPGVSGNPGGRRKERPFRDALRKVLAELADDKPPTKPKTKLEVVARAHVEKAIAGDVPAIKEIADRLDGKVPQALIGSDDPDDAPVQVALVELVAVKPDDPAS